MQKKTKKQRKQLGKGQEEPPEEIEIPQEEDPVLFDITRQKRDAYSDQLVVKQESNFKLTGAFDLLPDFAKKFIKHNQNIKIVKYNVCRVPVSDTYKSIMSILSSGKVEENMDQFGFDDLYHLYLVIELSDGFKYVIERNERINIKRFIEGKGKCMTWRECDVTVGELFERTVKKVKGWENLLKYDPVTNNCQNFVIAMLESNGLLTPKIKAFVKQDTSSIFQNIPKIRNLISNGILSIAILKGIFFN